jgi:acyl carrier protein
MIPAAIVAIPAWPLTPNGKIDRQALPAPVIVSDATVTAVNGSALESSATEKLVSKIWEAVLGRKTILPDENFFDVGGHSLLAAQVITRVNAAFPVRIPVRVLFDFPTLGDFTREVEGRVVGAVAPRSAELRVTRRSARPDLELANPS